VAPACRPATIPALTEGEAIEVDRVISQAGTFTLGGRILVGAAILAGRRVGIRVETTTLLLFDLDTRTLLAHPPRPLTKAGAAAPRRPSRRATTSASTRTGSVRLKHLA